MKNLQNKLEELGVEIISTPTFFSKSHIIIKKDSYYEVSELFKNSDIKIMSKLRTVERPGNIKKVCTEYHFFK